MLIVIERIILKLVLLYFGWRMKGPNMPTLSDLDTAIQNCKDVAAKLAPAIGALPPPPAPVDTTAQIAAVGDIQTTVQAALDKLAAISAPAPVAAAPASTQ